MTPDVEILVHVSCHSNSLAITYAGFFTLRPNLEVKSLMKSNSNFEIKTILSLSELYL